MSTAAEESKEAERNLPKAIILSLAIAMVLYLLAATVLRYRSADLPRTFRVPVIPLLGIAFSRWLVSQLMWQTWVRFAIWFVIGVVVYAAYGYSHGRLGRGEAIEANPEAEL